MEDSVARRILTNGLPLGLASAWLKAGSTKGVDELDGEVVGDGAPCGVVDDDDDDALNSWEEEEALKEAFVQETRWGRYEGRLMGSEREGREGEMKV